MSNKLSGLQKMCKLYGAIKVNGVKILWDYANECAVPESEMPLKSERFRASERAKREQIEAIKFEQSRNA